ncbi:MAG TPA: TIGR03619 family F420-dependent LLM class oxidoreductase [Streptosporangiaceae bacterium]
MRFGIALPQYGPAEPDELIRAAQQAEELDFDDVWVGDHLGIPAGLPYPPSFLLEPLTTLTFVAAATTRVRLGTGVLVLPYRHPLLVAKQTATLDRLSGERLILGIGAGFLQGEFQALNVDYARRGELADEYLQALIACWEQQPTVFKGPTVTLDSIKVKPQPRRHIPVWGGGSGERALRRAIEHGDGWQGAYMSSHGQTHDNPDGVRPRIARLRRDRPEASFTISMRVNWDGLNDDRDLICRELAAFQEAGVQHLVASPTQRTLEDWLRSAETLAGIFTGFA